VGGTSGKRVCESSIDGKRKTVMQEREIERERERRLKKTKLSPFVL
jgi:hypothetical protein